MEDISKATVNLKKFKCSKEDNLIRNYGSVEGLIVIWIDNSANTTSMRKAVVQS